MSAGVTITVKDGPRWLMLEGRCTVCKYTAGVSLCNRGNNRADRDAGDEQLMQAMMISAASCECPHLKTFLEAQEQDATVKRWLQELEWRHSAHKTAQERMAAEKARRKPKIKNQKRFVKVRLRKNP